MTTHKGMREDLEMVHHTLTNPRRRAEESKEHDQGAEAEKELHVKKLHDGESSLRREARRLHARLG